MSAPPASPKKLSFPKNKIKVLLLENINQSAVKLFEKEGFQVETLAGSLPENELIEKVKDIHILGIRSKTKVTKAVVEAAPRLKTISCFCIGTDQVDLSAAEKRGVPVFNSPFANTRSVAELVIAEIIMLSRKLGDVNNSMHKGVWLKQHKGCYEIRGKTLGIIGYGHVGSQVSVIAESLGMTVVYYDVISKLPLGNSKPMGSMEEVLKVSDFVTLHVPKTPFTDNLISKKDLDIMKPGSFLLNLSRGTVVDVDALALSLQSGHIRGAAVDVFPVEPQNNGAGFVSVLQGCPNTILTSHIGGSTEEAQEKIGEEVAISVIRFMNKGTTTSAVNFPQCDLPTTNPDTHRILNVHKNVPGVLKDIHLIISKVNVSGQVLSTSKEIGYIIIDLDSELSNDVLLSIRALPSSISTRILF